MQFYDALGLAPKLALDPEELKKRFYERSRQWHPDRFSRASAAEQQKSLEMTSVLNDAFRTLRDPVARAEYFLEQKAIVPVEARAAGIARRSFRNEYGAGRTAGGRRIGAAPIGGGARAVPSHARRDRSRSGGLFGRYDEGHDASHLLAIRSVLDRRQYIANLIRDVEKELNVHVSN